MRREQTPASGRRVREQPSWLRWILVLYPRDFRLRHGDEIADHVSREMERRVTAGGGNGVRLAIDLVRAAIRVRIDRRGRSESGRRGGGPRFDRSGRQPLDVVQDGLRGLVMAARSLWRARALSATVVLTIGIATGLSTSIFSALNTVMLRPLPYREADRLVHVGARIREEDDVLIAGGALRKIRERSRTLEDVAGVATIRQNLTGTGLPRQVEVGWATTNFFELLGTRAALGRLFEAGDAMGTAVLSDAVWRRDFGADPGAVGRSFRLDGSLYTIVGVLAAGFEAHLSRVPRSIDVWKVPDSWWQNGNIWDMDGAEFGLLHLVGRLRAGAAVEEARLDMERIAAGLREEVGSYATAGLELAVSPLRTFVVSRARPVLLMLVVAVAVLLLIACANVIGLLMVRAEERQRDVAVRLALGAGRGRVVSHLVAESFVLATAGSLLGLVLAAVGVRLMPLAAPPDVPRLGDVRLDGAMLGFCLATALLCTLVFGLMPGTGLWSRAARLLPTELRVTAGSGRVRTRHLLVVVQISASLVLLVCAGLLALSMGRLSGVETGFDDRDVETFAVSLPGKRYGWPIEADNFYRTLESRIEAMAGVSSAAVVWPLPLSGQRWDGNVHGGAIAAESRRLARYELITPGYFDTMRIRLEEGRPFGTDDPKRSVIVSRSLAERAWPGESAIGHTLRATPWGADTTHYTVIGVAADARYESLREPGTEVVYFDSRGYVWTDWEVNFVVRSADPVALIPEVRRILASMDPELPLADVRSMTSLVDADKATNRVAQWMFVLFASVAALLAGIGLYGIVAYGVRLRLREFGIRMALGSGRASIVRLALRQGVAVTLAGVGIGLVAALQATSLLRSLLFGTAPTDARIYLGASVGLGLIALLAAWLPARHATRLNPATVLRAD